MSKDDGCATVSLSLMPPLFTLESCLVYNRLGRPKVGGQRFDCGTLWNATYAQEPYPHTKPVSQAVHLAAAAARFHDRASVPERRGPHVRPAATPSWLDRAVGWIEQEILFRPVVDGNFAVGCPYRRCADRQHARPCRGPSLWRPSPERTHYPSRRQPDASPRRRYHGAGEPAYAPRRPNYKSCRWAGR